MDLKGLGTIVAVLIELMLVLRDCMHFVGQALLGKDRVVVQSRVQVAAPRDMIWDVLTAKTGRLEGAPPVNLQREAVSEDSQIYRTRTQCGEIEWETVYRVIEEETKISQFAELIDDAGAMAATDIQTHSHKFGFRLEEKNDGTIELVSFHEIEGGWRLSDVLPLAMSTRFMQRRIKLTCEERAELERPNDSEKQAKSSGLNLADVPGFEIDGDGVNLCFAFTGVLLVFCGAMVGFGQAAIFLGALVWHGCGIAVARKVTGHETPLIGMLPLTWQYAITENKPCTQTEQAFHSIVAIAFCVTPAVLLGLAYTSTELAPLGVAASIFAGVSLLHLMPMLPFDGGRLAIAAMDHMAEAHRRALCFGLLSAACFVAVIFQSYIIAALVAAGAFQLSAWKDGLLELEAGTPGVAPAETDGEVVLLIAGGYLALVGTCVCLIAELVADERLWPLLSGLPA